MINQPSPSEWEKEFDRVQELTRYDEYTSARFCCGGDYCRGDHLGFIKWFISEQITKARAEGAAHEGEEVRKSYQRGYSEGAAVAFDEAYKTVIYPADRERIDALRSRQLNQSTDL